VDYLVLSDVTVLIESVNGVSAVTDDSGTELLGELPGAVLAAPAGSPKPRSMRSSEVSRTLTCSAPP
jgi:hypothetical protein